MNPFHDREPAEATRLARDEEMMFRIMARRNKLLGNWAAARMDLDPAETESYARGVVQAEFEESGDEDIIRKVLGDLLLGGVDVTETEVRAALHAKAIEARRQLMGEA